MPSRPPSCCRAGSTRAGSPPRARSRDDRRRCGCAWSGRASRDRRARVMHQAAMQATGVEGTYVLRDVEPSDIERFIAELRGGRYTGCNVTTPYKAVIAAACDRLDGDAETLGVVNTVTRARRTADRHHHRQPTVSSSRSARRACGPATRRRRSSSAPAAPPPRWRSRSPECRCCACASPRATRSGAATSCDRLRGSGDIAPVRLGRRERSPARARIRRSSSTPPRRGSDALPFDPRSLPAACSVVDIRYRPRPVDVVSAAIESGHRASDGLEMLLQQGLLSFSIWTGKIGARRMRCGARCCEPSRREPAGRRRRHRRRRGRSAWARVGSRSRWNVARSSRRKSTRSASSTSATSPRSMRAPPTAGRRPRPRSARGRASATAGPGSNAGCHRRSVQWDSVPSQRTSRSAGGSSSTCSGSRSSSRSSTST